MVVAENPDAALEAVESIDVSYTPLDPVIDLAAALAPGAPRLHEEAADNICLTWEKGDAAAVEQGFAQAAHRVRLEVRQSRLLPNPLKPRAALGDWDAAGGRLTLYTASQGVHDLRSQLAHDVFGVPEKTIRVVTPALRGSCGRKCYIFPDHVHVLSGEPALARPRP